MKVRHSLKNQLERDRGSFMVRRHGVVYILNRMKPKLKTKQKNTRKKRFLKTR